MKRAIILPKYWYEEASLFIARLNALHPRYFLVPVAEIGAETNTYLPLVDELMGKNRATSAMFILPRSLASGDKIDLWPALVHNNSTGHWISSVFFADNWSEVEEGLQVLLSENSTKVEANLTCQYQPVYTEMLAQWEQEGGKAYHPGDYFKDEILSAISQMKGNWLYWGHGEGDRLRGYGHLDIVDLLSNKYVSPLNATLWFTCSTLDRDYPENIALAWYQSGATKCILASPDKVNTEANFLLSQRWLEISKKKQDCTIASLILEISQCTSEQTGRALVQYYLLGIPWVSGSM
ncbi:hypothetical protein [Algoriphagus aquimarinus]|uniref:hypothetical protein n=1 Tax=Algoriphagus aquimarinus TaxID=237018 RepID=UPI0030D6F899|tara:strand:+ start:50802 stop:51683 length:882 start_codon:yes stop_codon:yes gene_type:complete